VDRNDVASLAEMLDLLPERVVRYRLSDHVIVYCNASWAAGYDLTPEQAVGRKLLEFLSPGGLVGFERQIALLGPDLPLLADPDPREDSRHPGQWFQWVDRYHPSGEIIAVGRDVTDRHNAEQRLAESEARFRELADHSVDVVWRMLVSPTPHFDYLSPSVEAMFGHPPEYFLEDSVRLFDLLDLESRAIVDAAFRGVPMPDRIDLRYIRDDGRVVIAKMQTSQVPGGVQSVSRDVTELRRLQEHLVSLALRDPLTGLANRRLLQELLEAGLTRTKRTGEALAVAYVDLDGFKFVNDTYGHDAGDSVLCETARRLVSVARSADAVARVGGDEFVVVYEPGASGADQLVARLDAALMAPLQLVGTTTVSCAASIGHADTRRFGHDATVLLAAADASMFEVKRARAHVDPRPAIAR
jgi:diguanylate cyclase (GGDEF)-like protein/PAS domain S-box-containing protein